MTTTPVRVPAGSTAQAKVRRLVVYVLLAALVVIAANGAAGLLERALTAGQVLAGEGVAGLALSLAFALVGGPLAALLWWLVWRRLGAETERAAPSWGLYVSALYTLSLLVSTTSLLAAASSLVTEPQPQWRPPLAVGVTWFLVWVWHRWMWRHPAKGPVALAQVPGVIGTTAGLAIGAGAAVAALSGLFDVALRGSMELTGAADPWWRAVLGNTVWAAGGALVWWWHWFRGGARRLRGGFADMALLLAGVLAAGLLALGGAGTVLFVLLRLAFDRTEALTGLLSPLGAALAATAVGALVWRYHRAAARGRSPRVRQAGTLITSGVALAAAASGIGVVLNAALSLAVSPLAETPPGEGPGGGSALTLLLGGISSLAVGGLAWWRTWRPREQHGTQGVTPGRRVYLVTVFGLSAAVALVALLVIGYRLFELALADITGGSVVDRIRAPLGWLVAAGLASGYHFSVWRQDRTLKDSEAPAARLRIGRIILVTAADPEPLRRILEEQTGAPVTVWRRAGVFPSGAVAPAVADVAAPPGAVLPAVAALPTLAGALAGISAPRVLLIADTPDAAQVIALRD